MRTFRVWGFVLLALLVVPVAQAGNHRTWKDISDVGVAGLVGASLGVPIAQRDWPGLGQAALSDGLGEGFALAGKALISEERPNHTDDNSFPSGHTTLAFAAATTLYRRYGWQYGFPAYAMAALTGVARVASREHHWWDAVAGAAFGTGAGWLMTRPLNDHVQMAPWIADRGGGVIVAVRW
jgi:membrane-associated phospholipid phosphatase